MLTEGQKKYLATIPDEQMVHIKPFNPEGLEVADRIIHRIKAFAPDIEVLCIGSLPLKIAGQEDIDISAYCVKANQPHYQSLFKELFGDPARVGKNSTAWDFTEDGFSVSVWLTDPTAETTKNQLAVFNILKNNPRLLAEYERLKLNAKNLSYKQYQKQKYEFYNRILNLS